MITFSQYFNLLMEDLQSSLNQARNILQNNNAGENTQNILSRLEQIYNEVEFEDEQHKQANKDSNIPALAFWFIADPNFDRIKEDYRQYVNTRSLYQKNFLINSVENLKKEISAKKLFKPSEEKLSLIKQTFSKVAETIHSQYKPVVKSTDKKFVAGSTNDDVVYEDDEIIIYRADSKAKCIQYGAGSSLCISVKGGGNYYWSYRMGNMRNDGLGMTTYFVYWKDGSNRILIDALGDEDGSANKYSWNPITPNTDSGILPKQLISQYPELSQPFSNNVFQFIPYSEKEKRYMFIEENVSSILSSKLKTFEDYEMFVETGQKVHASELKELENRLSFEEVSILLKKYIWSGNRIIDIDTTKKYLSSSDLKTYEEKIIPKLGLSKEFKYFSSSLSVRGLLKILESMNRYEEMIRTEYTSTNMKDYLRNKIIRYLQDIVIQSVKYKKHSELSPYINKVRPHIANTFWSDDIDDEWVVYFDNNGYLDREHFKDGSYITYNSDEEIQSFTNVDGDVTYYTSDGMPISNPDNMDKYYSRRDGSTTYYDRDFTPIYTKSKNGIVDYYDDTENFNYSQKNRKSRRTRLKKESYNLSQLDVLLMVI